ncbi:MAG: ribosome biogenesis factor YjgA [Wenzhouxiangella sp.]
MSKRKRLSGWSSLTEATDTGETEALSKSARKRQAEALQDLGLALATLPAEQRRAIEMPEELREALEQYLKTRSHEGRRRQLQFVGKLLRRVDAGPLLAAVERFQSGRSADAERLHVIERWRDALIADDQAITRWIEQHPDTDIQQLRSLVRAARSEGAGVDAEQRQPKSYRLLFRLIRRALEAAESA